MSKLDELINEKCPDGVEYRALGDVCKIKRIFGKGDDENAIVLPKKQSSKKLSVEEKTKLKEYKDHTHTLELIVMILLLPPCLSLAFAAIFGALLNSPVAALIVGFIAYAVQVVVIIKLDKKRRR